MKRNFWNVCGDLLVAIHGADQRKTQALWSEAESSLHDNVSLQVAERRKLILDNYKSLITLRSNKNIDRRLELSALNSNPIARYKLSIVTSVFNRFWQLTETLPRNLETIRNYKDVEIILVDFGGKDSPDIAAMIDRDFGYDILSGRLKYFRANNSWDKFHMSTAKNVAHRLAGGEYLFSVDADNYVTHADLDQVLNHFDQFPEGIFHQTIGPAPLRHRQWSRYQLFPDSEDYHDDELVWDGSCGRIALAKKRFDAINGYNENFVGMGMDDIDFLIRSIRTGATYKHYRIDRSANSVFIDNGSAAKDHQHVDNASNWERMDAALANDVLIPYYLTDSPLDRFTPYVPRAVQASMSARVTLFSSVFRAGDYIKRFKNDIEEILAGTPDVVVWIMDVVESHTTKVSETLRDLALHDRIYYLPVKKDPGLYDLWNVALRNIGSPYVGNLNIDDLRGRHWLPTCLSMLDSGLADLASPVTVPFEDPKASSYDEALAALRLDGLQETRWFETRVVLDGEPLSSRPSHVSLIDGEYDHRDLFQVLPNGSLASYCIPNASPVWRRELHDRVGYFNEERYGCYADLALWIEASAMGFRLRQVDYLAMFYISSDQAHRRQAKDDKILWSLVMRYGSGTMRAWSGRRSFDLARIGGSYGNHHFLGWNWVRDQVSAHFSNQPGNLLLDMFVERNFFWNPNANEKEFYYSRDWLGFVHTTPHQSSIYDKKGQNLNSLLEEAGFKRSLPTCKGLIVLSETNKMYLAAHLKKQNLTIPIFRLFHPNIPIDLNYTNAISINERDRLKNMVFHIGWHLRSFSAFARLDVEKQRKVLLVPKTVSKDYFLQEVVNKDLAIAGMKTVDHYVEHIYTASQEEYQKILRWSIIFNQYIEPSGSNLISECISAQALLVINRHPAFEEYLGKGYPLFFDALVSPEQLLHRLHDPSFRDDIRSYLFHRGENFSVKRFCRELERIGVSLYAG